jgi:hypothetical protein
MSSEPTAAINALISATFEPKMLRGMATSNGNPGRG